MEPQKSSIGGIIGTIIIIAIIILGGLYFWGKRIEESKAKEALTTDTSMTQQMQSTQNSSSDDLDSIEADLNASSFDDLDAELNQ